MKAFYRLILTNEKDLKIAENATRRLNSSTTPPKAPDTASNPVEEYENLTNNDFESKNTATGQSTSSTNEAEVHPFAVAQANK